VVIEAGRRAFATRRRQLIAAIAVFTPLSFLSARGSQETADLIVTDAAVYTLSWPEPAVDGSPSARAPHDAARSWHPDARAVVARGGRIVFVGSAAGALRLRGSSTRVIDAHGAALLPGLVDAHVHLANLGASLRRVNLVGVTTEEEAVRRVAERAAQTPPGDWIIGYGWDEGAWANHYPDMKLLSARVPNHPVWLAGLHSFAGWGNRMAFERAGITAATDSPSGGEIRRDTSGQPTGLLLNNAVRLVESVIPRPSSDEMDARMAAALDAVARAGYTAVHDANTDSTMLASLERLARANRLPIRVSVFLAASDTALVRRWLAHGPDTTSSPMLVVRAVKAFYDGALGSRGALLLAPYSDRAGEYGRGGAEYGFNERLMTDAMSRGFQVVIHAIGDAANRKTLDFFERAFAKDPGARRGRHRIEHLQVLAPSDIPRVAKLNLIASMQPGHAVEDKAWAQARIGPERIRGAYAWRSVRRTGARMLLSSDMPGSDYDFFYMLHAAITRRDRDGNPPGGWYPAERLTPEEAVRGYTTWAAYASFTEDQAGTISVGKRADLTLVDRDPFAVGTTAPDSLLGGKAVATIVGGRVVFAAQSGVR
jgi:predicted amidohydrolase YtcJ